MMSKIQNGLPVLVFSFVLAAAGCGGDPTAPPESTAPPEPSQAPAPAAETAPVEDAAQHTQTAVIKSIYTELSEAMCSVTLEEDPPGSLLKCPGPAHYALEAEDFDARVNLSVVDPAGTAHSLELWRTVTRSFSALGPRAEWRLTDDRPVALIVRVEAFEDPENPDAKTSYLVVAKITPEKTCVVAKIPPEAEQNVAAREVADSAAEQGCLE